jgi:tetratricopeptide (TPR) repeat protein
MYKKGLPVCLFLAFILLFPLEGFSNFDFNANCLKAYKNIFDLKLNAARQLVAAEKAAHPDNSIVPLLENYIDYFYLITTESKLDFDRLKDYKSDRLDKIEDDKDRNSPYYLYAQAEINLQWALLRGKFGEYFTAAREIKRANSLLADNSKKFPAFQLNQKGLGLINAFLGNLPDGMLKSTLSTFGVKGNLNTGISMLDKLAEQLPKTTYQPFYEEVVFYYAYVLSDIAHSPEAYSRTMKYTEKISDTSLLKSYLQAYVCIRNGHNDQAIEILASRPSGAAYSSFPYLDLLMGTAKLNKLDYLAGAYFNKFLQQNKGVNYIKDANLHLAWLSLLKGDTGAYSSFTSKVKSGGYTYMEKDKQALNEAAAPAPTPELLKARLLFDGGYLAKASEILSAVRSDNMTAKNKTEFYYRKGRVNDELGKDDEALTDYQNAINSGKGLKYYFAANSALLMGKIYEKKHNAVKAKACYNMAISMKDHEYENSIESQAKQGLKRTGN